MAGETGRDAVPGTDRNERDVAVYAPESEGRRYRSSLYVPVAYGNLEQAPRTHEYPDRGTGEAHRVLELPRVPRLRHVLGPSAIMLGASLGSGETLFWPTLVAQNGWGLYWAFWIGVVTQFFINTELQRWTIATGESIFRAFERVGRSWPPLFLLAGFASLGWPGWAASAAKVGDTRLGLRAVEVGSVTVAGWEQLGIALMVIIWLSYQVTPLMYNVVERVQMLLVGASIACALALLAVVGAAGELFAVPRGAVSVGTLPPNRDIAVFLGGLAYAGSGGYLNLTQSLWVREKGYGMGRFQGRIKNPVVGDSPEPVQRDGFTFRPTPTNLQRWRGWWRLAQWEHFLTFVVGLLVGGTVMMAVASHVAAGTAAEGVAMWTTAVIPALGSTGRVLVFVVLFFALFTTEYAIVESFVRNSADVLYELHGRDAGWSLPRVFWGLLTVFVLWGVLILAAPVPVERPFGLLVIAAATSGVMMWPYSVLTLLVNTVRLPEHLQPGWARVVAMWWASSFFGFFSVVLVSRTLAVDLGLAVFRTELTVVGSAPGGYALFGGFLLVQAYLVTRTTLAKAGATGTVTDAAKAQGLLH